MPLYLMGDEDGMSRGPAWWFQQPYTKLVVVPDLDFNADDSVEITRRQWSESRQGGTEGMGLIGRGIRNIALPAAKPWFCYWNETVLEGFIYVTQDSSPEDPYSGPWQTAAADSANNAWDTTETTESLRKRSSVDPSELVAYSKVVKIEERRPSEPTSPPFCQQMQIMNDGTASPLADDYGSPNIISLEEMPPQYERMMRRRDGFVERDNTLRGCECEWVSS